MIRICALAVAGGGLLLMAACSSKIDESLTNLEIGDCILDSAAGEVESVDAVDCDAEGAIKVVRTFDMEGYGEEYPGDDAVVVAATNDCPESMLTYLSPTKESWKEAGDRESICFE